MRRHPPISGMSVCASRLPSRARFGPMSGGGKSHIFLLVALGSFCLLPVLTMPAESAGREVAPIRALRFQGWRSTLEVDGAFSRTRFERQEQNRRDSSRRFAPGLRLQTGGYVYHPRFLRFELGGRLMYSSARQNGDVRDYDEVRKQTLDEYSIRTTFLETNRVSFEWALDRTYSRLNVSRVADVITDNHRQTYTVTWRKRTLPINLSYDRLRRRTENALGSDERQQSLSLSARLRNRRTTGEFRLDRTRLEDSKLGYDYVRYQGVTTLNAVFDRWSTGFYARWWRQQLAEDLENIRLSGNATRDLGRGFEMRLGLEGERIERLGSGRDDHVGLQLGAAHQLYESLSNDVSVRLRSEGPSTGSVRSLDAQLATRYQKRVPKGRLSLNAGVRRIEQETKDGSVIRNVVGREQRFDLADRIELTDPEISLSSIEVTDSLGVRVYTRGIDYDLEEVGGGVLLLRVPGGEIALDAPVRISYSYRFEGPIREGVETVTWGARLRTDPGLYGKVSTSRSYPTRSGDDSSVGFSRASHHSFGAGWSRGLFGLDWERSRRDQRILPWERDQIRLRAGVVLPAGLRLTGDVAQGWTRFSEDGSETRYDVARASFSWTAGRRFTFRVEGSYRNEDTLSGLVEAWSLRPVAELALRMGRVTFGWREEEIRSQSTGLLESRYIRMSFRRQLR